MQTAKVTGLLHHGSNLRLFRDPAHIFREFPGGFDVHSLIPADEQIHCLECLQSLKLDCEFFGLSVTLAQVNRVVVNLHSRAVSYVELERDCADIFGRLDDELDHFYFLALDPKHVPYYEHFTKGWEVVLSQFASSEQDVEEASKCLALNRYTAVVFHLMRVMESGLRALGHSLNDPRLDPKANPTWERILQRCREEQGKPIAQRSSEWREDEPFYSGVSVRLMAVKDAWRNPTMHVEQTYTEEMAIDVFNHVQAFMRHLATKLSEPPEEELQRLSPSSD